MVMNRLNQRRFWNLYRGTGALIYVTYIKLGDDQSQGTQTSFTLHNVREKKIHRTGENINVDMTSSNRTIFQIPKESLDNAGMTAIPTIGDIVWNNVDATSEGYGQKWQVESTEMVTLQLFGDVYNLGCLRIE